MSILRRAPFLPTLAVVFDIFVAQTRVHRGGSTLFFLCVGGAATMGVLLGSTGWEKGRSAARKTVAGGGAYLNNVKIIDEDAPVTAEQLLAGGVVLVRKGRRNLAVARQNRS